MKTLRLVGLAFVGFGLIALAVVAVIYQRDRAFRATARATEGQVIELVPSHDSDGTTYASRVRFTAADGRAVTFVESMSSRPPRHDEGERVTVLYDPRRPTSAAIDDFWGRWGAMVIVGAIGMVFALLGGFVAGIDIRAGRRVARVRRLGTPIEARFLETYRDQRLKINGAHPFRVAVQATDPATGALRRYDSEPIWVDPTERLAGRTVPVLVHGRHHLVDLRGIVDDAV